VRVLPSPDFSLPQRPELFSLAALFTLSLFLLGLVYP
jgi:hypothetical protein